MHEPQDHPPGPNSRRGKPLAPIQTTFTPDPVDPIQAVQRPPPVETIIYKTSPKRTLAVPEQSTGNRRASRNFLGLFGRSKSLKDSQAQESASAIEQDESRSRKTSYSSGMSSSKSIESKPRKSSSTRKEKSQKLMMTWDPLPLIQAHSQAVRHATLSAPATSAESLLRAAKKKTDVSVFDSLSTGSALPFEDEQPEHGNKLKKGGPPAHALSWTTKTFVLTVSGFLLQYAGSGTNERLPEKILQLTADSAAYASDVIPGRHWVLRVTSSKEEDNQPAPPPPKSMFSKFSHRNEPKRSTTDVLLVMENADDMSSWLVSVRKVIQALGGQSYRPDESSHKDPSEAIQRLQQKPSRRFLIQRNPDKDPDPSEISPKAFSPEEDTPLASNGTDPFTLDRHTLTHVNTSASVTSEATMRPNARDTTKSKLFKRKSKEGVKSTRPTFPPPPPPLPLPANNEASASLLKWELPENFAASFSGTALNISTTIAEHDPRRESVSSVPSLSSQGRSHRSLSEQSDSQAPNFSLPTFSNRFSHSTKSGTIGTPPTSSGSAFRNDSPVSPLEETPSKRKISISYETPAIVEQPVREHMAEASDTVIPLPEDPSDWEDADDLPPLMAPRFKSPPPKRLSSLQHRDEQLPLSDPDLIPAIAPASVPKDVPSPRRHPSLEFASSQPPRKNRVSYISHLPPQQPPPTGALPAIPSSPTDSSATRPSFDSIPSRKSRQSAEIRPTTSPKLRRPASMQVRPRAISQSVEKPDGVPATLQPAVSQPLTPPAKIRERRSFVVQPPSHILGPPPAPPPSNPLPSIPQPKSAPPKVDTLNVESPPPSPTVPTEDLPTSPRTTSLAATASINAGQQAQTQNDIRQNDSRHVSNSSRAGAASPVQRRAGTNAERRRSAVAMLNDPTVPAPGEMQQTNGDTFGRPPSRSFRAASPHTISRSPTMADPHHHSRAPSIGELHQELEQEQEAQVNRLLQTIRSQQSQITALQAQVGTPAATGSPTSERSFSFSSTTALRTRSPAPSGNGPGSIANRSRRPSQASLPPPRGTLTGMNVAHGPAQISDESAILSSGTVTPAGGTVTGNHAGGGSKTEATNDAVASMRHDVNYFQAGNQALTRENQMLKARIKELEKQLNHSSMRAVSQSDPSSSPTTPHKSSNLVTKSEPYGGGDGSTEESANAKESSTTTNNKE